MVNIPRRDEVMKKLGNSNTKKIDDCLNEISKQINQADKFPLTLVINSTLVNLHNQVILEAVRHALKIADWGLVISVSAVDPELRTYTIS